MRCDAQTRAADAAALLPRSDSPHATPHRTPPPPVSPAELRHLYYADLIEPRRRWSEGRPPDPRATSAVGGPTSSGRESLSFTAGVRLVCPTSSGELSRAESDLGSAAIEKAASQSAAAALVAASAAAPVLAADAAEKQARQLSASSKAHSGASSNKDTKKSKAADNGHSNGKAKGGQQSSKAAISSKPAGAAGASKDKKGKTKV